MAATSGGDQGFPPGGSPPACTGLPGASFPPVMPQTSRRPVPSICRPLVTPGGGGEQERDPHSAKNPYEKLFTARSARPGWVGAGGEQTLSGGPEGGRDSQSSPDRGSFCWGDGT